MVRLSRSPLLLAWLALTMTSMQVTFLILHVIHDLHTTSSSLFPGEHQRRRRKHELRSAATASSELRMMKPSFSSSQLIQQKGKGEVNASSPPPHQPIALALANSAETTTKQLPVQSRHHLILLSNTTIMLSSPVVAQLAMTRVHPGYFMLHRDKDTENDNDEEEDVEEFPFSSMALKTKPIVEPLLFQSKNHPPTNDYKSNSSNNTDKESSLVKVNTRFNLNHFKIRIAHGDDDGEGEEEESLGTNTSSSSSLYWNLSCPLELTMFAGSHMGGSFLHRAQKARAFVDMERVLERMLQDDWPKLQQQQQQRQQPRRIFLVGDSLMRQVFISWACLLWQHVESYAIPWFDESRQVRAWLPNTIFKGPHSKFEEGRVRFRNNTLELIYHHGMGGLLALGKDFHDHDDTNLWHGSCLQRQPMSTNVIDLPDHVHGEYVVSESTVIRQRLEIHPDDVVLMNGSVHNKRQFSLHNMVDLLNCMQQQRPTPVPQLLLLPSQPQPPQLQSKSIIVWPTFAYVMTGPEHFPTETGAFEARLLQEDRHYKCRRVSTRRDRQDEELALFSNRIPVLGQRTIQLESTMGHLHVGGRDCLHWLQPGMPDLIAAEASHFVASLVQQKL